MNFKRRANLTVAVGLTALAGFGAAKAVESKGGVGEVFESIRQESAERVVDRIKRESGEPRAVKVGSGGLYDIFEESGWSEAGVDFTYYEEAIKSINENKGVDFNQPQEIKAYYRLDTK